MYTFGYELTLCKIGCLQRSPANYMVEMGKIEKVTDFVFIIGSIHSFSSLVSSEKILHFMCSFIMKRFDYDV